MAYCMVAEACIKQKKKGDKQGDVARQALTNYAGKKNKQNNG